MFIYEILIVLLMIFLNAIFAAYEMGIASVSKARLMVLFDEKRKGAHDAVYMKNHIEASLTVIQLGINLVGAIAAATGGLSVGEKLAPFLESSFNIPLLLAKILAVIIFIIPLTCVIIIFGELVPKMIAIHNKEWIVLKLSPSMKAISRFISPIINVVEAIVKKVVRVFVMFSPKELTYKEQDLHELKAAVSLARTAKILGAREERIVLSAASFTLRPVRDIIIPAHDISMIFSGNTLQQALVKAHLDMHTRFPVCTRDNDPQSIEGYINFKDIVTALKTNPSNPSIREITRPIKKVPAEMVLSQLLEMMIQEKIHIVLVVSNTQKVLGLVTLEDIIEELTGDIEDEFDYLPNHVHACGTSSWIMGGGVPMTTVAATLGLDWSSQFKESKVPTLAEWCKKKTHNTVTGGEIIENEGLRIVPRKFRRKKLSEAVVSLLGASNQCS